MGGTCYMMDSCSYEGRSCPSMSLTVEGHIFFMDYMNALVKTIICQNYKKIVYTSIFEPTWLFKGVLNCCGIAVKNFVWLIRTTRGITKPEIKVFKLSWKKLKESISKIILDLQDIFKKTKGDTGQPRNMSCELDQKSLHTKGQRSTKWRQRSKINRLSIKIGPVNSQ